MAMPLFAIIYITLIFIPGPLFGAAANDSNEEVQLVLQRLVLRFDQRTMSEDVLGPAAPPQSRGRQDGGGAAAGAAAAGPARKDIAGTSFSLFNTLF